MRVLGVIPARSGSRRVIGKNTKLLNNRPLIEYILKTAGQSKLLTDVAVTTNDGKVLKLTKNYDHFHFIKRPNELCGDESMAIAYVQHALVHIGQLGLPDYDAFCILQPTSPFTSSADIDGSIELMRKTSAKSVVTVARLDHMVHPLKLKRMVNEKLISYFQDENGLMANHQLEEVYVRNGSVYLSKISVLESGNVICEDCYGYLMPTKRSIDINDELDFQFAEFLMSKKSDA